MQLRKLSLLLVASALPTLLSAQALFDGTTYTQNFSSLDGDTNVEKDWFQGDTITGWYARSAGGGDFSKFRPTWESGISAGELFLARNTTEDAPKKTFLGARTTSGIGNATVGLQLQNTTGATLTSFDLSFLASQFHKTGVAQQLQVSYSTNASSLTTGDWSTINSLTYTAPYTTGNALVSSAEEIDSRATLTIAGQSVNWANNEDLWIRFTSFRDLSGEYTAGAAVLAVTDVSFAAIPEPGTYALLGGILALGAVMLRRRR